MEEEMKKLGLIAIAVIAALTMGSCGFLNGAIYGEYYTDGTLSNLSLGGFPEGTVYTGYYYDVAPDTHDVYYTDYYGGMYYPGDQYGNGSLTDATWYWHFTYSVYGTMFSDQYFTLYLDYDGLYTFGTDGSRQGPVLSRKALQTPGTTTVKKDGLTITITGEIVQLNPEQAASLKWNIKNK
jgi:hypothetical protein